MIADSIALMTVFDIVIILCPIYLFSVLVRRRNQVEHIGLMTGTVLIVLGIAIIAGLFLVDLYVMHVHPGHVSTERMMQTMNELHLGMSWFTALGGIGSICLGMAYLLQVLIPRAAADVSRMQSMVLKSNEDLQQSKIRFQRVLSDQNRMRMELGRAEGRFSELLNMLPQTVFEVSPAGEVMYTNSAGSEMFRFTVSDVEKGMNIADYFDPADRARGVENFKRILAGETLGPNEYAMLRKDGTPVSAVISSHPIVQGEDVVGVIGIIFDNTGYRRIETDLQASRKMLRLVLDTIPVRVFWKDLESNFLGCNMQFARDAGFESPVDVIGKNDSEISGLQDAERFRADDLQVLQSGIAKLNYEEARFRQGAEDDQRWLRTSKIPLLDSDGEIFGVLGCYEDITTSRRLSQQLEYLANHDELTGLVNRRAFEERLSRVLLSARSESSVHALCYIDLDQFKVVNDTCGHSAGDELLNQLAVVLQKHVRNRDTLARLGGDEFGVLMEHCSMDQAQKVANKLRQTVAEFRFTWDGRSFTIGASIGVVPINESTINMSDLLMKADAACYTAKDMGRNRIHVYREGDFELAQREGEIQWVSRIHDALEKDQFVLFAQPIVALGKTNKVRHFEVLTRMVSGDGKLILPGAFCPAAERYSLSTRLDRWVVAKSFSWLALSRDRLNRLDVVSINLSGHSLSDEEFQSFVSCQLEEQGIPASKICFEITETAAISNFSRAIRFISALKNKGCRFALDDFGSGLSSFAYLKNLPVDYLKIDGMFVTDILDDPVDLAMVRSINEIGQLMGKETIAEFVENDQLRAKLEEIGVNYIQGYSSGLPVPIEDIL